LFGCRWSAVVVAAARVLVSHRVDSKPAEKNNQGDERDKRSVIHNQLFSVEQVGSDPFFEDLESCSTPNAVHPSESDHYPCRHEDEADGICGTSDSQGTTGNSYGNQDCHGPLDLHGTPLTCERRHFRRSLGHHRSVRSTPVPSAIIGGRRELHSAARSVLHGLLR